MALIALAFVPGFWSGTECEAVPAGPLRCRAAAESLFAREGARIVVLFGSSAVLAGLGVLFLHESRVRGRHAWRVLAWTTVGLLFAYALAALFSIGLLLAPTVLLLAAAVAISPIASQ